MKTIFDLGIEIEQKGLKFYIDSAKIAPDQNSINLLKYLACEEKKHEEYFKKLKQETQNHQMVDVKPEHEKFMFNKEAYKEIDKAATKMLKIFETAIQMEENSIKIYTKAAENEKDEKIKKILLQIAEYEQDHKRMIKEHSESLYNYLYWEGIDPAPVES